MNLIAKFIAVVGIVLRCMQSTTAHNTTHRALATLNGQNGVVASSLCFLPSGEILTGPALCPDGEVQLLGQYINLGIHRAASMGTTAPLDSTYYQFPLGLIADYDRNGFASPAPGYSGDYFNQGIPVEGTNVGTFLFCSLCYP